MGMITDPPAGAVIASARSYKEASRDNPDGVQYMDHLWELIAGQRKSLTVVMRTTEERFDGIPIRCWWQHGWYKWQDPSKDIQKSTLLFEVPDEVWRRIQSRHARRVMQRMFGVRSEGELSVPVGRAASDQDRIIMRESDEFTVETFTDDWSRLRQAIEMSATDAARQLGGQSVQVALGGYDQVAFVRVVKTRLELTLPAGVLATIEGAWNNALKQELNMR